MLVLTRQKNEEIIIAPGTPYETSVMFVGIRGDKVRLGITAPKSVAVHRREVYEAIQRESRKSIPPESQQELDNA